jgi:FtsH-binding integral membrane protein
VRPLPHRGDLIAAGAVPFTLAIVLLDIRMDATWGHGIHLVITALACGLVLGLGFRAEREEEHPRAYQTVLLLAGLVLLAVALVRLAQVLGSDAPLTSSGALTWMTAVFAAVAAVAAWGRIDSPICALVEFLAGGLFLLSFVDWVFDPRGPTTVRWLLVFLIAVYVLGHVYWRERKRRHAVNFVNAAGVAAIVLAVTFVGGLLAPRIEGVYFNGAVDPSPGSIAYGPPLTLDPGTWWELVLLAAGLGLVAYAAVDRERGPGYLGFVVLALFAVLAGLPGSDGASIVGWPLLLLLAGGAALAAGLRPSRPLPPAPDAARDPAPTEPLPPPRA